MGKEPRGDPECRQETARRSERFDAEQTQLRNGACPTHTASGRTPTEAGADGVEPTEIAGGAERISTDGGTTLDGARVGVQDRWAYLLCVVITGGLGTLLAFGITCVRSGTAERAGVCVGVPEIVGLLMILGSALGAFLGLSRPDHRKR